MVSSGRPTPSRPAPGTSSRSSASRGGLRGGSEQGYNTDARPLQFDENKSPQFTRSLTLGEVPVVNVGGVEYREFLLDINQKSSASLLSLDEVRVFLGGHAEPDRLQRDDEAARRADRRCSTWTRAATCRSSWTPG